MLCATFGLLAGRFASVLPGLGALSCSGGRGTLAFSCGAGCALLCGAGAGFASREVSGVAGRAAGSRLALCAVFGCGVVSPAGGRGTLFGRSAVLGRSSVFGRAVLLGRSAVVFGRSAVFGRAVLVGLSAVLGRAALFRAALPSFGRAAAAPLFASGARVAGVFTGALWAATTPLPLNSDGLELAATAGRPWFTEAS